MNRLLSKPEYEAQTALTRDARMQWFREARFGVFVHYGLYSQLARGEWAQVEENIPVEEYEKLALTFDTKPGAVREWARLAKEAGARYMVMTTRHHEGFSLWDSRVNPFNSVNYGPHRDLVREFVEACREFGLRIGLYSSLMDWHHPDGWLCAVDREAQTRFLNYIEALNTELLTNYGRIDMLWYDLPAPMVGYEGWDSVARNQRLRALQPDIIINNRSGLQEDLGTPEESLTEWKCDWEACMTFNGLSWGYVDDRQVVPYSYNAQRILQMLHTCCTGGGNLLLNIGPKPDGSLPADVIQPLQEVGRWLGRYGEMVYGDQYKMPKNAFGIGYGNGLARASRSADGKSVYLWCFLWPTGGDLQLGGYLSAPEKVTLLTTGAELDFEWKGDRLLLKGLPEQNPDPLGVAAIRMDFAEAPKYRRYSAYPQLLWWKEV